MDLNEYKANMSMVLTKVKAAKHALEDLMVQISITIETLTDHSLDFDYNGIDMDTEITEPRSLTDGSSSWNETALDLSVGLSANPNIENIEDYIESDADGEMQVEQDGAEAQTVDIDADSALPAVQPTGEPLLDEPIPHCSRKLNPVVMLAKLRTKQNFGVMRPVLSGKDDDLVSPPKTSIKGHTNGLLLIDLGDEPLPQPSKPPGEPCTSNLAAAIQMNTSTQHSTNLENGDDSQADTSRDVTTDDTYDIIKPPPIKKKRGNRSNIENKTISGITDACIQIKAWCGYGEFPEEHVEQFVHILDFRFGSTDGFKGGFMVGNTFMLIYCSLDDAIRTYEQLGAKHFVGEISANDRIQFTLLKPVSYQ